MSSVTAVEVRGSGQSVGTVVQTGDPIVGTRGAYRSILYHALMVSSRLFGTIPTSIIRSPSIRSGLLWMKPQTGINPSTSGRRDLTRTGRFRHAAYALTARHAHATPVPGLVRATIQARKHGRFAGHGRTTKK